MNTDDLEQQAMAKAYNVEVPDELIEEEKGDISPFDPLSRISDIIKNHTQSVEEIVPIYQQSFSYLKIQENHVRWHLIKWLNNTFGMILSDDYILDYSSAKKNTESAGEVFFRLEKEYHLEYRKSTIEEFHHQMNDLEVVFPLIEKFETDRNQFFYEYEGDAIYLYQDGYVWRLSGYSRNDICEYYQMYLLLMSLDYLKNGRYTKNELLKHIYLIEKNALYYLYKGIDLKKESITSLKEKFQNFSDTVIVSLDNHRYYEIVDLDYYLSKRKKRIDHQEEDITIKHFDSWVFEGVFHAGILGDYAKGELLDFSEIFASKELSEPEKKEMLKKIVLERERELSHKKTYLNNQFLLTFFRKHLELLTPEKWMNFLKLEKIPCEELTEEEIGNFIKKSIISLQKVKETDLEESIEWKEFSSYIDFFAYQDMVVPLYLTITPLFLILECRILGMDKTYILTENYEFMEWL